MLQELLGDGIRLLEAPAASRAPATRWCRSDTDRKCSRLPAWPRRSARGRALKRVNRVTSAVFADNYSFSFA